MSDCCKEPYVWCCPVFPQSEVIDSVLLGSTCSVCGGMVKQNWVTAFDHKTDVLNLKKVKLARAWLLINYSPVRFIVSYMPFKGYGFGTFVIGIFKLTYL